MPMDPQLAAIYGTNQDGEDVEKLAAAELAEKLAADGEVEIAELTDEQAEELAQSLIAGEKDEETEVEEPETEEEAAVEEPTEKDASAETEDGEAEAQEKLAEADKLGRVMAHAYVQELRKIAAAEQGEETEKTAEPEEEPQVSAVDQLAERRAMEILKANGIDPSAEEKVEEPEKKAASESEMAALQAKVEARAWEILEANGFAKADEPEAEAKVEEKPADKAASVKTAGKVSNFLEGKFPNAAFKGRKMMQAHGGKIGAGAAGAAGVAAGRLSKKDKKDK